MFRQIKSFEIQNTVATHTHTHTHTYTHRHTHTQTYVTKLIDILQILTDRYNGETV